MIDWKRHFDAVFMLHYAGYGEIENKMNSELKRVGLADSGILTVHDNISSPFLGMLSRIVEKDPPDMRASSFSCSFGHYSILKIIELKHIRRALVLEDDVVFMKDLSRIESVFTAADGEAGPAGYDVCLFSHFQSPCCERSGDIPKYMNEMSVAEKAGRQLVRFDSDSAAVASGAAYGVSFDGAVMLRGLYEHQVQIADMIFRDIPYHAGGCVDAFHSAVLSKMRRFYCRTPVCLQNNARGSVTGNILGNGFYSILAAQRQIAERAGIAYSDYNFESA